MENNPQIDIPKNLVGAKILRFERSGYSSTITMFAQSDFGDDFSILFFYEEEDNNVEMKIERIDSEVSTVERKAFLLNENENKEFEK